MFNSAVMFHTFGILIYCLTRKRKRDLLKFRVLVWQANEIKLSLLPLQCLYSRYFGKIQINAIKPWC